MGNMSRVSAVHRDVQRKGGLILWSNIGTGFKKSGQKKFTRPGYKVKTRFTKVITFSASLLSAELNCSHPSPVTLIG